MLKDQAHAPGQRRVERVEREPRAVRARRVDVVTACVHHPRVLRAVVDVIELLDRERVEVRPDADRRVNRWVEAWRDDVRDQAGALTADANIEAQVTQPLSQQRRGLELFVTQLGVRVDVTA